jgi:hypothetical protein
MYWTLIGNHDHYHLTTLLQVTDASIENIFSAAGPSVAADAYQRGKCEQTPIDKLILSFE